MPPQDRRPPGLPPRPPAPQPRDTQPNHFAPPRRHDRLPRAPPTGPAGHSRRPQHHESQRRPGSSHFTESHSYSRFPRHPLPPRPPMPYLQQLQQQRQQPRSPSSIPPPSRQFQPHDRFTQAPFQQHEHTALRNNIHIQQQQIRGLPSSAPIYGPRPGPEVPPHSPSTFSHVLPTIPAVLAHTELQDDSTAKEASERSFGISGNGHLLVVPTDAPISQPHIDGLNSPGPENTLEKGTIAATLAPSTSMNKKTVTIQTGVPRNSKVLNNATAFVNSLPPAEKPLFKKLCSRFNQKDIDETDFYVGVYRLLRSEHPHLLDAFLAFLPLSWRKTDLSWLNQAIVTEAQKPAYKEITAPPETPVKRRKRRPANGFTTATYINESPPTKTVTPSTACLSEPKLIAKTPSKSSAAKRSISAIDDQTESPVATTTPTTSTKRFQYGNFLSSEVTHYGPVFATRRAVLSRASKPYVHAACGMAFTHPDDVRKHHGNTCKKKKKNTRGAGEWAAHPSCKIRLSAVTYTRVKDGFVILDQESYDKVENCVADGLRSQEEADAAAEVDEEL